MKPLEQKVAELSDREYAAKLADAIANCQVVCSLATSGFDVGQDDYRIIVESLREYAALRTAPEGMGHMEDCTDCGRVESYAPFKHVGAFCAACGNTGVPDPFVTFPAGPRAPSIERNDFRRAAVREALDEHRSRCIGDLAEATRLLAGMR